MQTVTDAREAEEIRDASARTGLRVHSVMNIDHWTYTLSSPDPEVVARSIQGMETSLRNAKLWGADAVLLVPAVVNAATSYQEAWTRSQKVIRERLLPRARGAAGGDRGRGGVEQVPPEPAGVRAVRGRASTSPWLKAYFDVGNVVFYGFPQDWIRVLGPRIVRVHLKDFSLDRAEGRFQWKNLGEGDIDWPSVRKALPRSATTGGSRPRSPAGTRRT